MCGFVGFLGRSTLDGAIGKESFSLCWVVSGKCTNLLNRATYVVPFNLSSSYAMVYSGLKIYVYYMFVPFPWQVGSLTGLYAGTESIMRMILIYFSVKQWCNACGLQRRLLGLMFILYFSMTFMWAVGTTNYGTAMRHHMLSWWIIVIIGIPPLMTKLNNVCSGMKIFRRKRSLKSLEVIS